MVGHDENAVTSERLATSSAAQGECGCRVG